MAFKAIYHPYLLHFEQPAGTSRGVLHEKPTYFLELYDTETTQTGLGECSTIVNLSIDDRPDYEDQLERICNLINLGENPHELGELTEDFPSIRFGLEMALLDLQSPLKLQYFDTPFRKGEKPIEINGLIWMGSAIEMLEQINTKLKQGFSCLKLKIGAIDFEEEIRLLKSIRERYPADEIEIRVDANGAFAPAEAMNKLEQLAEFELHSIEQPIKQGQIEEMARLCKNTPLPIALDEELIGTHHFNEKEELIREINPHFIILKPSLIGGFKSSEEWIKIANDHACEWWATSALESNIGLNAIAQWTDSLNPKLPQGLGTGQLYTNNIPSPLQIEKGYLHYDPQKNWDLSGILLKF